MPSSGSESVNLVMEDDDDSIDLVELDKSNVLLLGPTGSGLFMFFTTGAFLFGTLTSFFALLNYMNRKDLTGKNFSASCQCSFRHC